MTHCAVIEAGPGVIRRLCCGTSMVVDVEMSEIYAAALAAIDDPVALVDERPVSVASLWRDALRSLDCGNADAPKTMVVVHPSWWPASRVGVVTAAAAKTGADGVDHLNGIVARPRSWLLTQASNAAPEATVVVEIAERLVSITGDLQEGEVVAVPRRTETQPIAEEAEEVASVIASISRETTSVVLIDAPSTVAGATAVATLIAAAMRDANSGRAVVVIDDARLPLLVRAAQSPQDEPSGPAAGASDVRSRAWKLSGLAAAGVVLAAAVPAVATTTPVGRHGVPATERQPTTFLVEGRVALTVPANWPMQRVVDGPGSARVQVTSPSDPELALHVTQSSVPDETLTGTAERLKRAIDAEPAGVFVDFNPSGTSAGRPAVTYREVRAGHHVRWTVLLDGAVRISIGCQSRPGGEDAVREVCEQAVRSAHAFG
jgi:type VII secretion-associated protein (TIGR03931 family)